jgi:hypothetical protein
MQIWVLWIQWIREIVATIEICHNLKFKPFSLTGYPISQTRTKVVDEHFDNISYYLLYHKIVV